MGRSRSRGATVALLALLALVMGGTATGASAAAGAAMAATVAGGMASSGNAIEAGAPLGARGAGTGRSATVVSNAGGTAARLAATDQGGAPPWLRWLALLLLIPLLGLLFWAISRRRPRDSFILERDPEAGTLDPAEVTTERIVRPGPGGTVERSTDRTDGPRG